MKTILFAGMVLMAASAWGAVCQMPDSTFLNLGDFVGANAFYERGIYGQNVNVANLELHIPDTGQEIYTLFLKDVDYSTYYPSEYTSERIGIHQNQTLSIMAGYNASYSDQEVSTGLAYKAKYTAAQVGESSILFSSDNVIISSYEKFFSNGTEVISSSWKDSGTNSHIAGIVLDSMASKNASVIFVAAAANDGDEGAGTVCSPYKNMNVISVGALDDTTYFQTINPSSSYGPNDFYNPITKEIIKDVVSAVDISAPGTVYTVKADETLGNVSGTSFAAPIVSSVATLMVSYSKETNMAASSRDARLVKAILLNSASKQKAWNNGSNVVNSVEVDGKVFDGVISTQQSLDYYYGAGALDAEQALAEYDNFGITSFLDDVSKDSSTYYHFYTDSENLTLTATLCWFVESDVENINYDYSGNISSIDASLSYFSNLDLRLWYEDAGGEDILIAQSISDYNNVEHLFLTLDKSGNYTLEVYFKDMVYGDTDSETYALAWNVSTQIPEPAHAALILGLIFIVFASYSVKRR